MIIKSLYDFCMENENMKHLLEEWDYEKNTLVPSEVAAKSHIEVWWICDNGHSWKARIESRANNIGCPYCSGRYAIKGETDLATTRPDLAKQWHPTKNKDLKPTNITSGSNKKVWWICKHEHEWKTSPNSRTNKYTGCPICSNKQILVGFNDLATTHPEIVKEWHPTKNEDLLPTMVTAGSPKKVWWKGECGHEWEAQIRYKAKQKTGCQVCAGKKVLAGFNDFPTTCPELLKYWDYSKNTISLTEVSKGSEKEYYWIKDGQSYLGNPYNARKKYKID